MKQDIDSECDMIMVSIIRHGLLEKPQRLQGHMMIPRNGDANKDMNGNALFYPSPTHHPEAIFPVRPSEICTVIFVTTRDYQKYATSLKKVGVHVAGAEDGSCALPLECMPGTESLVNTGREALAAALGMDMNMFLPPPQKLDVQIVEASVEAGCNDTR